MRDTAIFNTHPNVVNIIAETIAYDVNGVEVSLNESLIQAEINRLQAEYNAKEYQRQRQSAYPSILEQLDMQYWDAVNGTTTWQDTINAIKVQYPKVS
jgi:hypothetical protein